jgi:ABC-type Fe3+ transport system permease subunit
MVLLKTRSLVFTVVAVFLLGLVAAPASALEKDDDPDPNGVAIAADFLVIRPIGIAGTVLGSALFLLSLPFSAAGKNVGQAARTLVVTPAKFTFTRPLGKF